MNLNHLAVFHAVAREGGFTRGGEARRITQPAVSRQVRELEEALGLELIDRSARRFRLTQAGELLAGYARRIFALEADAERALEELRGLRRGRLAVGASTTIGIYLLPPVFGAYRQAHPEVELDLEIANTELIQQRVLDHELALGLTEGLAEDVARHPELEAEVFLEDELIPIVPAGHRLARRGRGGGRRMTIAAFCREPLIFREHGSGTRVVIERALAERGIEIHPIMALGSTEAIKRAILAGIGLGIVSRLTVESELAAGTLVRVPMADFTLRRPLHLLRPKGAKPAPAVAAFLDLLATRLGRAGKK